MSNTNFGGLRPGVGGGSSSVNHSRGSSLAEDGYVHMAPMLHDDGYVDMHHRRNTAGKTVVLNYFFLLLYILERIN